LLVIYTFSVIWFAPAKRGTLAGIVNHDWAALTSEFMSSSAVIVYYYFYHENQIF
jgi:hypothetical protein